MFSSLFKRKPRPAELSLDMYAAYPIYLMFSRKAPFSDWKDPKCNMEPDLEESFRSYVNMYQIYTYYILTAKRFGYEIADKVISLQAERLSRASQVLERELYPTIQWIHNIVVEDHILPLELRVAIGFLTLDEESPFHITKTQIEKKEFPDWRKQDEALAACLIHGRTAAFNAFTVFTEQSKVTL
jgi:hypothetical protein